VRWHASDKGSCHEFLQCGKDKEEKKIAVWYHCLLFKATIPGTPCILVQAPLIICGKYVPLFWTVNLEFKNERSIFDWKIWNLKNKEVAYNFNTCFNVYNVSISVSRSLSLSWIGPSIPMSSVLESSMQASNNSVKQKNIRLTCKREDYNNIRYSENTSMVVWEDLCY
jgi:hypothetical protein